MERASQAANRALSTGSEPRRTNGSASLTREQATQVAEAWRRFTEMYGPRWTSEHGVQPPAMPTDGSAPSLWLLTLANLKPEELAAGFQSLIEQGDRWPPSLSEFHGLCRPKPPGVRYLGRPISPRSALPRPTARAE